VATALAYEYFKVKRQSNGDLQQGLF